MRTALVALVGAAALASPVAAQTPADRTGWRKLPSRGKLP